MGYLWAGVSAIFQGAQRCLGSPLGLFCFQALLEKALGLIGSTLQGLCSPVLQQLHEVVALPGVELGDLLPAGQQVLHLAVGGSRQEHSVVCMGRQQPSGLGGRRQVGRQQEVVTGSIIELEYDLDCTGRQQQSGLGGRQQTGRQQEVATWGINQQEYDLVCTGRQQEREI